MGGNPADITDFPYMAMFFNANNMCGTVILNSKVTLTAAHCFDYNKDTTEMCIHTGKRHIFILILKANLSFP